MEKKMTYAVAIDKALEVVVDEEVKARLADLKASLQKRASSKKATKTQVANEGIKTQILEVLAKADAPMTATKVMDSLEEKYSIQKVSALLKALVDSGEIVKTSEKKVSLFALATDEEEGE